VGAGLFGTLLNAWQAPLADVGPQGEDKGKGGKYLGNPYTALVTPYNSATHLGLCEAWSANGSPGCGRSLPSSSSP
jgi:hypothetical protein